MDNKTTNNYWDSVWCKSTLPMNDVLTAYTPTHKQLDNLFKKYLLKNDGKMLELGCAKGSWLVHFAKEFGYFPEGIDFSETGCQIAKRNLEKAHLNGKIMCGDIFTYPLNPSSYDLVYSMGLVEHFKSTCILDKHLELLKIGGYLIISMPNYKKSFYYYIKKFFGWDVDLKETHNLDIIDEDILKSFFKDKLKIEYIDYFGPINLFLLVNPKNKAVLSIVYLINFAIGYLTFNLSLKFYSRYLIIIGKRR